MSDFKYTVEINGFYGEVRLSYDRDGPSLKGLEMRDEMGKQAIELYKNLSEFRKGEPA